MTKKVELLDFNDDSLLKSGWTKSEIDNVREEYENELKLLREYKNDIAQELKKYKEINDLSIRQLRDQLGSKSNNFVQGILNGTSNLTAETVIKIAQLVGKQPHVVWK
ncbi:hypothetical protein IB643_04490 [Allofrancisella guangzhouensis]|uniref:helix-turn-helix domain-containing protein n=1 Tax=Allofrancisella guangzhouensis TaxID=594679 RepID=UPI0019038B33|nr:helix-turn-helix domain-containing protein [Allofrancisella guangzhouensis]MBK2027410.1 hypothetical protein [Allofrancisella guangzhouensis]